VLVPRFGPRPIVPTGMLLSAGAMAWLTALDANSTYAAHVLPPLLVMGLGLGMIFATGMNLATAGVREYDAGVASAMVNTSQQVGGSIGTSLLNTLAASAATSYMAGKKPSAAVTAQAQLHSYSTAYWWSAGLFGAGFLITLLLYRPGVPNVSGSSAESAAVPL
jgi:nitrate/nitrite transporter NarK